MVKCEHQNFLVTIFSVS